MREKQKERGGEEKRQRRMSWGGGGERPFYLSPPGLSMSEDLVMETLLPLSPLLQIPRATEML